MTQWKFWRERWAITTETGKPCLFVLAGIFSKSCVYSCNENTGYVGFLQNAPNDRCQGLASDHNMASKVLFTTKKVMALPFLRTSQNSSFLRKKTDDPPIAKQKDRKTPTRSLTPNVRVLR